MGKNTSVSLGEHFESFVADKIRTGRFNSASEVIRSALRLLEDEEKKLDYLNEALLKGEQSGIVKDYDSKKHLKELHERFK